MEALDLGGLFMVQDESVSLQSYSMPPLTMIIPFQAKSVHRLNPLHKGKPSGITDCTDREYRLHQEQGGCKQ